MRPLRVLGKKPQQTQGLLRAVRMALGLRAGVVAERLDVNRSVLFRLEKSEEEWRINLNSMSRVAAAMGCEVVYGIIPQNGATLEQLAGFETVNSLMETAEENRLWTKQQAEQVSELSTSRLIELTKRCMETGADRE
jgi:transcriptional regulator with XRE-family HTH domain